MICYRDLAQAAERLQESVPRVVTVGIFDGLHLGHRRLLSELRGWASELGGEPSVVTFDRHPMAVLRGHGPLPILSLRHRCLLLARYGVEASLVLPFTRELSLWSPEEFVTRVCVKALGARHLLFGFDSAFGRGRRGTFEYIDSRSAELGITARQASVERVESQRVSSTLVRQAVVQGDLEELHRLLGRPFSVLGKVVPGDGRGRTLGFPTANLDVEGAAVPPVGVYFASVRRVPGADAERIPADAAHGEEIGGALANLGKRPTFFEGVSSGVEETVEVHLPGFSGDLYDSWLELSFLHRHRPEKKFASADELSAQIRADVEAFQRFEETEARGRGG